VTAWIPVWALVQLVGTNPLALAESVIFGTMLGLAAGLAGRSRAVESLSRSVGVRR
jgi:hypothetical protein